jgi:uncharacterized protein with PIN domain
MNLYRARNVPEPTFVADAMLGKLAKWLRVLGYDSFYQRRYDPQVLAALFKEGRFFLTRQSGRAAIHSNALWLASEHVGEQLQELKHRIELVSQQEKWFSRCLSCNNLLIEADSESAREGVPEYVFYRNRREIRFCPSCKRYYWPGSHRDRMLRQLRTWGF